MTANTFDTDLFSPVQMGALNWLTALSWHL